MTGPAITVIASTVPSPTVTATTADSAPVTVTASATPAPTVTVTPSVAIIPPRISMDKHCELLTNLGRDKTTAMYDGFKLFVQMMTVVIGAAVAGRLQFQGNIPGFLIPLANLLALMIFVICSFIILDAFRSWWGYRRALTKAAGKVTKTIDGRSEEVDYIPEPRLGLSSWTIFMMVFVMFVTVLGFVLGNPLQTHHPLVPDFVKRMLLSWFPQ